MNYRMWHFRGEYIFENTIVRMQIAICDDEKSIGLILEEKKETYTVKAEDTIESIANKQKSM